MSANPCESLPILRVTKERTSPVPAADCPYRAIHTATGTLWPMLEEKEGALLDTLIADTSHQPPCWLMVQSSQESKQIRGQSNPHIVILP